MSSRKGNGSFSNAGSSGSSSKGKGKSDASVPAINQLAHGVSAMNVSSGQDEGWEVYGKKSKGRLGSSSARQPVPQNPSPKAWGQPDTVKKLGLGSCGRPGRGSGQTWTSPSADSKMSVGGGYARPAATILSASSPVGRVVVDDDDSDEIYDSDDDIDSDGFDSDEIQKSHETRKKNKWFKSLFQDLEGLTIAQINEPERRWHCPACKGGPGAIDWYPSMLALVAHAKTRTTRWKLHRDLAEVLEEELSRRGMSAIPAGEVYGKWKGLEDTDRAIVWPPMVMIMNTRVDQNDEDNMWIGMGNQELTQYFSSYSIFKARHSYGPQGHRGISVLIFDDSPLGYVEAERLNKQFEDACRDRSAWGRNGQRFAPGGLRLLYGFMAEKLDIESFNQHSPDNTKLKYEIRSYQEMVVKPMKQMIEYNQQMLYLTTKVAKEQSNNKALVQSHGVMAEKWRKVSEENKTLINRTKKHHEQNKEQMDYQDKFYREGMQQLHDEKIQYEANKSLEQRVKNREELIPLQEKQMEEYVRKRDEILNDYKQKVMELMHKHWEEEVALEKEFDAVFDLLWNENTPK